MKRLFFGFIAVAFLLAGLSEITIAGPVYVVCVRSYKKQAGRVDGTDYRGRSVSGVVTQDCSQCCPDILTMNYAGKTWPENLCNDAGFFNSKGYEFTSLEAARAFFREYCDRCW